MTRKQHRIRFIALVLICVSAAAALVLGALKENITYFYTPSEVVEKAGLLPKDRPFRLGGMVVDGSLVHHTGTAQVAFTVTDYRHSVPVVYEGLVPNLFKEGSGVVARGTLRPDGVFVAKELLAKHDENYMPPEVADALKGGRGQP